MEEDHHQYGMSMDLRHYLSGRPLYPPPPPTLPQPQELLVNPPNPFDMLVFRSATDHSSINNNNTNINSAGGGGGASSSVAAGGFVTGFEMEAGGFSVGGGRWPRQETLTLLEIRSRLDPKFKEANQKGPLWDEVSRLMSEDHGYQRSGKKCREKFENLYKYYKKTKDGKAGRQDGKHYRFFRQLEALYGDANNSTSASEAHIHYNYSNKNALMANYNQDSLPGSKISDTSLSLSNLSESDTTSSDDSANQNDEDSKKKKRSRRSWKIKIKDFIDGQMRKLIDKQEVWMEKIMTTIEQKEQERIMREEEWRKQDATRIEMEHKLWASERAWIEARHSALMDAFHKMTGKEQSSRVTQPEELMDIRSHESICNKKRNKGFNYYQNHESSICNQGPGGGGYCDTSERGGEYAIRLNDHGNSSDHHQQQGVDDTMRLNDHLNSTGNAISDSCFRYFMGDAFGRIMD